MGVVDIQRVYLVRRVCVKIGTSKRIERIVAIDGCQVEVDRTIRVIERVWEGVYCIVL